MSGLRKSPSGPRELKPAMTSPRTVAGWPAAHVAVTPLWVPRKASRSAFGPSRWTDGTKWLSVSVSLAVELNRIIPLAPPSEA